ncbi:hypothetical protein BT69DRAFT_334055 [Atractiella rhizophila]|nr:hypothetical protein BT69DRAFT_334055 [Atractiella rhizophila]
MLRIHLPFVSALTFSTPLSSSTTASSVAVASSNSLLLPSSFIGEILHPSFDSALSARSRPSYIIGGVSSGLLRIPHGGSSGSRLHPGLVFVEDVSVPPSTLCAGVVGRELTNGSGWLEKNESVERIFLTRTAVEPILEPAVELVSDAFDAISARVREVESGR